MKIFLPKSSPTGSSFSFERVRTEGLNSLSSEEVVVNWGSFSPVLCDRPFLVLNHPNAVAVSRNKLESLRKFSQHNVPCVSFLDVEVIAEKSQEMFGILSSKEKQEFIFFVKSLVAQKENTYICRQLLTGSRQAGLVFAPKNVPTKLLPFGWLYTEYRPPLIEYRIHVIEEEIVLLQERDALGHLISFQPSDYRNVSPFLTQISLFDVARSAVRSLGLQFGAVDIGVDFGGAFVFEVNSAPGLCKENVDKYSVAFERYWGEQ